MTKGGRALAKIKLVVTDLDGTFLQSHDVAQPDNVRALRACEAAGVPVCCVTGRSFDLARRPLALGGFHGLCVTSNGCGIQRVETGETLYNNTLCNRDVRKLLEIALRADVHVMAKTAAFGVFCRPLYKDVPRPANEEMRAQWPPEQRPTFYMTETIDEMLEKLGEQTQTVSFHKKNADEMFPGWLYDEVISQGEFSLTSSFAGGLDLEIMPPDSGKRNGVIRLAQMMGIRQEEVMACGDHVNDLGMLRWAGIGVVMGDADARVQAEADYISVPHDQGGVADAIERFVLRR